MTAQRASYEGIRRKNPSTPVLRQLTLSQWPIGMVDAAFTVRGDIDSLAEKRSLEFSHGVDNLDDFEAALVRVTLGGQIHRIGLQAYDNSPSTTFNVMVDRPSETVFEFLVEWLDLSPDSLVWTSPEAEAKLHRAMNRRSPFRWLTSFRKLQLRRSQAH